MHFQPQHGVQYLSRTCLIVQHIHVRHASLTSAISRGIRKAAGGVDRLGTYRNSRDTKEVSKTHTADRNNARPQPDSIRVSSTRIGNLDRYRQNGFHGSTVSRSRPDSRDTPPSIHERTSRSPVKNRSSLSTPRSRFELERTERAGSQSIARARRDRKKWPTREGILHEAPLGVPYTTAGSEFLYGTFAVTAALEAERRRLYKLYVWRGEEAIGERYDQTIASLAKSKGVTVQHVAGDWDKMLMKMSGQRPHNGYVLEASPVPKLPVTALYSIKDVGGGLAVGVGPQSAEDQAMNKTFKVSTSEAVIPRTGGRSRYPLLLWLDRITDTGNIGAIIRTALFFGVDAVLIPEHGTAPFNPVTIKASAGAAEHLSILTVKKEIDFVHSSQENGWRFYAAVAPKSASTRKQAAHSSGDSIETQALYQAPCVLMMGNEGEGLRSFLQQAADESVSIRGVRGLASGVESLNVSVAAALLIARFLSDAPAVVQPFPSDTSGSFSDDGTKS